MATAAAVATVASPSPASRWLLPSSSSSSSAAPSLLRLPRPARRLRRALRLIISAAAGDEADVLPGPGGEAVPGRLEEPSDEPLGGSQLDIGGLAFQGDVGGGFAGGGGGGAGSGGGDGNKALDRGINTAIVLGASTYALTKLLTVDQDYWHGWTIFEILRYMPEHNWSAYEEALKANPVLAKMMISGIVYSLGDWIAQCYEGKPIFDFDRARMFRSGLVGFTLHGSLSHYYYHICEAGWKLWPFAHLITYGVVPVEQRLLWVDCVELVWVTILSTYSNEKSEARISDGTSTPDALKDNSR
ncbi:unnamed protein product [Urochloa humidicola]